jgi:hypothetical protein
MREVKLTLTRSDYRRGRRNSPSSCLVARALVRQEGGKWRVGSHQARRRGEFLSPAWKASPDTRKVIEKFDAGAPARDIFGGRKSVQVTLRAPGQRQRKPARKPARKVSTRAKVMTASAVGTGVLIADGKDWVVFTAMGAFLAALIGLFTWRKTVTDKPVTRPRVPEPVRVPEPELPWNEQLDLAPAPEPVPVRGTTWGDPAPEPWPEPAIPVRGTTWGDRDPEPAQVPDPVPEPDSWPLDPVRVPEPVQEPEPVQVPESWPPETGWEPAVPEPAVTDPVQVPERVRA